MDKTQARLASLEKETAELIKIIEAEDRPTPEQWMNNFINENSGKFTVKFGQDRIVYYLDGQWIFDLDLKNKILWCYYYKIWNIFYDEYNINFYQTQQLIKNVVLKPLNCYGFTPDRCGLSLGIQVLKPLNCDGFTPYCCK